MNLFISFFENLKWSWLLWLHETELTYERNTTNYQQNSFLLARILMCLKNFHSSQSKGKDNRKKLSLSEINLPKLSMCFRILPFPWSHNAKGKQKKRPSFSEVMVKKHLLHYIMSQEPEALFIYYYYFFSSLSSVACTSLDVS